LISYGNSLQNFIQHTYRERGAFRDVPLSQRVTFVVHLTVVCRCINREFVAANSFSTGSCTTDESVDNFSRNGDDESANCWVADRLSHLKYVTSYDCQRRRSTIQRTCHQNQRQPSGKLHHRMDYRIGHKQILQTVYQLVFGVELKERACYQSISLSVLPSKREIDPGRCVSAGFLFKEFYTSRYKSTYSINFTS
jgi:hypothetical protein